MGIRVKLDDFGMEALEGLARSGRSRDAVIRAAIRYYVADRGNGRVAWRVPVFARRGQRGEPPGTDVELDDDTMEALEQQARRQCMAPGRLAEHALLYFLADLDSGRAASHCGDALAGGE
jgi:predicted transcriptional regulator